MIASHPFWNDLVTARGEGRPRSWTNPLGGPIATPEQVFDALLAVAARRRTGDGPALRIFADRRQVALDDGLLPADGDGSTGGYVRRLDATLGETGLVVNDLHAAAPDAWRVAVAVCAGIQRAMGVAPGGFSFDLFAGAYRSGFFGVHKDDQEVVTFVIEGRKRFLLWPYEVLRDDPRVPPHAQDKVVLLSDLDYAHLRDRAIVVEGGPGDVFYWPADHWHVAESDGGLCTTFGLGLFARNSPTRLLDEAVQELVDEGVLPRPGALPSPRRAHGGASALLAAARGAIGQALDHPEVERRLDEKLIALSTSFGMRRLPPPLESAPIARRVRLLDPSLLAWTVKGDEILWSVAGSVYRYPALDALVTLLSRLASGLVVDVGATSRELSRQVEPAVVRHVLSLLARHHTLVAEPSAAEDAEADVELAPELVDEALVLGAAQA